MKRVSSVFSFTLTSKLPVSAGSLLEHALARSMIRFINFILSSLATRD
jgi:hypothetical protein